MSETISNVGHVENFNPAMMDENRFSIIVDLADPEDAASAYYERYEASIPEERVDYYGNDTKANEEIKPAFIAGAKWLRQRTTEEVKTIFEWFAHIEQMASDRKTATSHVMSDTHALDEIRCLAHESQEYIRTHLLNENNHDE
ncbi:MAG: hypothetical protein IKD78_02670 [Bacteroidales bacterium]|nr:hypothetical protein [Bacteroidales bacterium]